MSVLENIFSTAINLLRGDIGSFGELTFQVYASRLGSPIAQTLVQAGKALIPDDNIKKLLGRISETRVVTFNGFDRRTRTRYARHELINGHTLLEKTGQDTEVITLSIKLVRGLCESPEAETDRIRKYVEDGYADFLIVGDKVLGDGKWVITELNDGLEYVDCFGRVLVSTLNLTFESYWENQP